MSLPHLDDGKQTTKGLEDKKTARQLLWFGEGLSTMKRSLWFAEGSRQAHAYRIELNKHHTKDLARPKEEIITSAAAYVTSLKYERYCAEVGKPEGKEQQKLIARFVAELTDLEFEPDCEGKYKEEWSVMKLNAEWQAWDAFLKKQTQERREKEKKLAEKKAEKDSK